jgi:hypothetical protein
MSETVLLTDTHQQAPTWVNINGNLYNVAQWAALEEWGILALGGVYRHISDDGTPGHDGYTDWLFIPEEPVGPAYYRYPIMNFTEPGDHPLGYEDWERLTDTDGSVTGNEGWEYNYRVRSGTAEEREAAALEQERDNMRIPRLYFRLACQDRPDPTAQEDNLWQLVLAWRLVQTDTLRAYMEDSVEVARDDPWIVKFLADYSFSDTAADDLFRDAMAVAYPEV